MPIKTLLRISIALIAGYLPAAGSPLSVYPKKTFPGGVLLVKMALTESETPESHQLKVNDVLTQWDLCPDSKKKSLCAFIGIPLDDTPKSLDVRVGELSQKVPINPKQYPKQKLRVPPKHVDFSPEDQKRIDEERALLKKIFQEGSKQFLWKKAFQIPCKGKSTSVYGMQRVFNGQLENVHYGLDLRANEKTQIKSSNFGKVAFVGNLFNGGNYVAIDHGGGIFTSYAHLSSIAVKNGEEIQPGQKIGMAGSTGRVTGPHLHWSVLVNGLYVDPLVFMEVAYRK